MVRFVFPIQKFTWSDELSDFIKINEIMIIICIYHTIYLILFNIDLSIWLLEIGSSHVSASQKVNSSCYRVINFISNQNCSWYKNLIRSIYSVSLNGSIYLNIWTDKHEKVLTIILCNKKSDYGVFNSMILFLASLLGNIILNDKKYIICPIFWYFQLRIST